jgi:3-oxoacyl-[acyl-carrier-protein] synthase II
MRERRVVITGLGTVTAIGNDLHSFWNGLVEGRNGIQKVTKFDVEGFASQIAAEVKELNIDQFVDAKEARKMDPFTQLGLAAGEMAVKDSGLNPEKIDLTRVGTLISSGIGGMDIYHEEHKKLLEKGPRRVSPFFIPMMIPDITAGHLSIKYGFMGPNYCTVSACASAAHALGVSYMHIISGDADVMVAGGSESVMTPMAFAGFCSMKALSFRNDDPAHASRPFDKERDGFVMGEGAGILVLEELEHAKKRGAQIYAELAGYGFTGDAFHITAPHEKGAGAVLAMRRALEVAEVSLEQVDYINAHGTSTPPNDRIETMAIKTLFGDYAKELMISSNKSMIGHLLGAAGAVEAVATIMTVKNSIIPPTINYEFPDPECDLDYVPNAARNKEVKAALSNSFGFGGHNVSLCFKKFED